MVDQDYVGHEIFLVGVLCGAIMAMTDLTRRLHTPVAMNWMAASSCSPGTKSSGVIRILKDLSTDIKDRHVLIVENIIDSGSTLSWLEFNLRDHGCASLNIAALLHEPDAAKTTISPRYVGFDIPNEFVVGYSPDHAEEHRNLPLVELLAPHVYEQL